MNNLIIAILLFLILAIALRGSVKHFRGEGGCCGGNSTKVPKKKLKGKVIAKQVFSIEGMHCSNCANRVVYAINGIDGASAKVSLRKKTAIVSCDRVIDPELIRLKIEEAGYQVQ